MCVVESKRQFAPVLFIAKPLSASSKMKIKHLLFITFFTLITSCFGQNIQGKYSWIGELNGPNYDYAKITIEIENDSTYIQIENTCMKKDLDNGIEKWTETITKGKILKKEKFYVLISDGDTRSYNLIKFKGKKLIVYGYKNNLNSDPRILKGIALKKASR